MPTRASRLFRKQKRYDKHSEFTKTSGHSRALVKSFAPPPGFQQRKSIPKREGRIDHCVPMTSMGADVSI
jgi:hypothetical protein